MNSIERNEAREYLRRQKALEDPVCRLALQYAESKRKQQARSKQILDSYGLNGYIPPQPVEKPRAKTEEELRIESIMKHY